MEKLNMQFHCIFLKSLQVICSETLSLTNTETFLTHFNIGQGMSAIVTCVHRLQKKKCVESETGRQHEVCSFS